jgi:prepilin signal peptidase PulO-like enzyme (type II secretory pathway)
MLLMIIAVLVVLGLCFGSFANALVWRVHEQAGQAAKKKPDKKYLKQLSVAKGRSMCPNCKHELVAKDLIPVLSWLALGGKCRYCAKPISIQYPLVEVALASLFVVSYLY